MKLVFLGTPEFGATVLQQLIQAGLKPVLVVTPPDKPAGRKQQLTPCQTKVAAKEHGIPLLEVDDWNKENIQELKKLEPDLFLLASFGKILPKEVLDIPKKGTLNVHPSLLPKYRGPSPVQETILQGEEITGVTIMLMDEEIDHGPILAQQELPEPIGDMNAQELKAKLAVLGGNLLSGVVPQWMSGTLEPQPQDHAQATFTKRIRKGEGKIDWKQPAWYIARQIRAFDPWPGAFCSWEGKTIKILEGRAEEPPEKNSVKPGTLVSWQKGFAVVTGKGVLAVERLQLEGRNEVSAKDFLQGYSRFIDSTLT